MTGAFDFTLFEKELTSINGKLTSAIDKLPSGTAKPEVETLKITALSWNIMGKSKQGCSDARNVLVPIVVGDVNPDVVLLQETKPDFLVKYIASKCSLNRRSRSYKEVNAGDPREARVLYDSEVFEIKPARVEGDMGRKALVRLEHKLTRKQIIFMSFHNENRKGKSKRLATTFCRDVSRMAGVKNTLVVAGADFNCDGFEAGSAVIPPYEVTERRLSKKKIDYFILASPGSVEVKTSVTALKIIPSTDPHSSVAYSRKQYNDSLDHDPLVCELSIM